MRLSLIILCLVFWLGNIFTIDVPAYSQSQRPDNLKEAARPRVYRDRIQPNWFAGSTKFWYRNDLPEGTKEFVLVDAIQGKRTLAFDHNAVAQEMGVDPARLPITEIEFSEDGKTISILGPVIWEWSIDTRELRESKKSPPRKTLKADSKNDQTQRTMNGNETEIVFENKSSGPIEILWIAGDGQRVSYGKIPKGESKNQHTFGGHSWAVVDNQGKDLRILTATDQPSTVEIDGQSLNTRAPRSPESRRNRGRRNAADSQFSPDMLWRAYVQDNNVYVENTQTKSVRALSNDGDEQNSYDQFSWSPNSQSLVAFRVQPGEKFEVHLVQSSPKDGGRAELKSRPYSLPGDAFPRYELNIFEVAGGTTLKPSVDRFEHEYERPRLRWNADGSRFTYEQTDRGHQRFRLIEVDVSSGEVRNCIDETSKTFLWTAHADNVPRVTYLESTRDVICVSERSGWRHAYWVDTQQGTFKHAITSGDWVFRGIERIDEENQQLWFRASGCMPGQDPYLIHFGRVQFDGSGLVWLTQGDGNHVMQYSPDRNFAIDTYSRVDMEPVSELRRVSDGKLVCDLERADVSALQSNGWKPPIVLSSKGRDSVTDIWGFVCLPRDFDPNRKYPVLEDIYAGPHGSHVPKSFSPSQRSESLTDLGFIVVKIDGMGTANRSKAFHDVCWQNLRDAGFEDRILWMQAAAKQIPQMDLSRVGIFGTSAGGQNAAAAVLHHPEFYKAAAAACGCHDNRMDKASWNEQWMGYPVGPQYGKSSNIDNAGLLGGKLLLIVGEMDTNVPPESTMRFADALIRARKDFDLVFVPNAGHGNGGEFGQKKMREFFVRHLAP